MSYQHLTTFERARIETMMDQGLSLRQIGKKLKRAASTISRELKRNAIDDTYYPEQAQDHYQKRRLNCGRSVKWSPNLADRIHAKLSLTWSPEQIAHGELKGDISFKTIYRWLYQGWLHNATPQMLRQKGKRQKPRETRGRFNIGTSIKHCPKEVRKRETFGHWELGSVVSSRGHSKGCLATFVERKTRWYTAIKTPDGWRIPWNAPSISFITSCHLVPLKQLLSIAVRNLRVTTTSNEKQLFESISQNPTHLGSVAVMKMPMA
ncbi:IS30 family transposase [Alkalibacillus flavidus]|uniref:IS30 family transposase n=1 Tax=Alkalibacillus flavidus TaxID=546021 RepID=A0ABV2KUJ1_9BACI